jgi:hypothetical protein
MIHLDDLRAHGGTAEIDAVLESLPKWTEDCPSGQSGVLMVQGRTRALTLSSRGTT